MPSPPPFNPYARTSSRPEPSQSHGDLRERMAVTETTLGYHSSEIQEHRQQLGDLWRKHRELETAGAQAVQAVPALISAALTPVTERLAKLEATWLTHLRPHMWKVWLGLCLLLFAGAWRKVTGEPVPIRMLVEIALKWLMT